MMQYTLALLKPDAVQRDLLGRIIGRFEEKGLQVVGLKMFIFSPELLEAHYDHISQEPFFLELATYMTSGPSIALCLKGTDSIQTLRSLVGVTKAREAAPGTIRGDLAMSVQRNLVHASDSVESARAEIERFFSPAELYEYEDSLATFTFTASESC